MDLCGSREAMKMHYSDLMGIIIDQCPQLPHSESAMLPMATLKQRLTAAMILLSQAHFYKMQDSADGYLGLKDSP